MIIILKLLHNLFGGDPKKKCLLNKKPEFNKDCQSLLCKYLTDDVFTQLKDKVDKTGFTLQQLIHSGCVNQDSSIGVYAGSEDSYVTFAPLIDKIIEHYHGFKPNDSHVSDWDVSKVKFENLDRDGKYIISTRIRVARNLAEFPLGTGITKEQRLQVESAAKKAFSSFTGDLEGQYYSLQDMKEEDRKQLVEDHFLFKQGDRFLEECGLNRNWPEARGIFHNKNKTFLVWVNEEDEFRIISMQNGGDIAEVFERLARASAAIEKVAKFAHTDHLGYITTCPTNLGTGMRASVHVKLPHLCKDKVKFENIAKEFNVQIRGVHGEHSESEDGIFDVSNKRRLGYSEVQCVTDMYNGVKKMIEEDKNMEEGVSMPK